MKHIRLFSLLLACLLTLSGCMARQLPSDLQADPDAVYRECWPGTVTDIFTEGGGADAAQVIALDIKDHAPMHFTVTGNSVFLHRDAAGETYDSDLTAVSVGAWVEIECLSDNRSSYHPIVTLTVFDRRPDGDASSTLWDTPPALTITWGDSSAAALSCGYSLTFTDENGEMTSVIADSAHPLQCRDLMTPLSVPGTGITAQLQFELAPDVVEARCWTADHWDGQDEGSIPVDIAAAETETADGSWSVSYAVNLLPGEYIYEICARWGEESPCQGTAYYCFCTQLVEP